MTYQRTIERGIESTIERIKKGYKVQAFMVYTKRKGEVLLHSMEEYFIGVFTDKSQMSVDFIGLHG